ncbi:hypothetical protein Tco_1354663 [Tanacetum coccineum]
MTTVMPYTPYAYVVAAFLAPPSPDYVTGPKYLPSPEFIPEPVYLEFMPLEDEILLAEDQPLPAAVSPTADSPGYVPESDPKEHLEEDDDEDPKEDLGLTEDMKWISRCMKSSMMTRMRMLILRGMRRRRSTQLLPTLQLLLYQLLIMPHLLRRLSRLRPTTPVPTPVWSDAKVARLLAISTPPLSLLSSWSSPLPQILSPPLPSIPSPSLPVSPPLPVSSPVLMLSPSPPASPIRPLGYRAAMIRLRAKAASTSYSLPLPPPIILSHTRPAAPSSGTPPLHLLSTDRREDRSEVTLPPRNRLGIALGPAYEVGESSSAAARPAGGLRADYGFVATINREIRRDPERDVGYGITDS